MKKMKRIKKMKKIAGVFAVTVFAVLALSVAAFAADDEYSIKVSNPVSGETYSAYKIFDVSYSEEKYSYTISADSEWLSDVSDYASESGSGLKLTLSADESCYLVETTDGEFSAAAFAEYLAAKMSGKSASASSSNIDSDKTLTLDVSSTGAGYYLVTCTGVHDEEEATALAELTTTDPSVTITDKNVTPTVEKTQSSTGEDDSYTDEELSVQIGDTVYFKVESTVPDTTGYSTYTFKVSDELSEGLTFNSESLKIMVGGQEIENGWTITTTDNGFEMSIDMASAGYTAGDEIVITYEGVVNENAQYGLSNNKVTLTYSNDPNNPEGEGTDEDETDVYDAIITVYKVDGENGDEPLAGASFVLQNEDGQYYYYNSEDNKVEWVDDIESATELTSGEDGYLYKDGEKTGFVGLEDGKYYLIETAAPEGYNILTQKEEVEIDGAGEYDDYSYEVTVENNTGSILPGTGGMGTTILYVIGAILVIGAGITLVVRRRAGKNRA